MNEVIINKALFTLVCTDYGKENADAILDILSNTTYTIDLDYVEELYSKQLLLFRDHETLIKIIIKLSSNRTIKSIVYRSIICLVILDTPLADTAISTIFSTCDISERESILQKILLISVTDLPVKLYPLIDTPTLFMNLTILTHLDKHVYSDFLTEKRNNSLLREFIMLDTYENISLVKSMRILLGKLVLPKESQLVILVLEIFSEHFLHCNNLKYSSELIFQFICNILMLNTDLHNDNVRTKITLKKFIHNWYKNIDHAHEIDKNILIGIYKEISKNKFTFN